MGWSRRTLVVCAVSFIALAACGPGPTPSPTERPTPTPVPGPTLGPGVTVNLMAANLDINPATLEVPANTAFVIHFRNADPPEVPHRIDIQRLDGTTIQAQKETLGGTTVDYAYDPLPAGDYVFICSIHPIPQMTGTLRVR